MPWYETVIYSICEFNTGMAPWGVDSVDAGSPPAGKAFSFLSKSLSTVQKNANQDIQLIKKRAKSFRDLANTIDREWESFKFPSLSIGDNATSDGLLRKFKDSSRQAAPILTVSPLKAISSQVEDIKFFENLRPALSPLRRSQSDSDLHNTAGGKSKIDLSVLKKALAPLTEELAAYPVKPPKVERDHFRSSSENRLVVRRNKKADLSIKEWEPLRRVRKSLKDLETSAAASKSPSEFFQNVQKTELFENFKNSLKISLRRTDATTTVSSKDQFGGDVAPLDVPELLENLLRQSEPFLDQLGVRKDVSSKVCKMLRNCKKKDTSVHEGIVARPPDSEGMDELDLRVASVLQSTGYRYKGGLWGECAPVLDLSDGKRKIAIVTTASLPWMTGTAVNPLFRAAYLAKDGKQKVTLLIPWLCKKDQERVYPSNMTFSSPEEQEVYVRKWLEERVGFKADFKIAFYPGKFSTHKRSILACGDISQFIPDSEADVAVLEEPEHLTWYYHGKRWNKKFRDVVGVIHTNYLEYVKREKCGGLQAFFLKHVNNWVVNIYCNKVLRLSAATQNLPKSTVCNVHGVSPKFLEIGKKISEENASEKTTFSEGAYFLGKMIWGKGYRELVDLLTEHKQDLEGLKVDVYGTGEDAAEVKSTAERRGLAISFHPGRDHADDSLHRYKVFINPSVSDVVCTTTAEALAMGKIVVCADHPSNEFFRTFPNCMTYRNPTEFVEKVKEAMMSEPMPLSPEQRHLLSWESATDRFLKYADLVKPEGSTSVNMSTGSLIAEQSQKQAMSLSLSFPNLSELVEGGLALVHHVASGIEPARLMSGAIPGTMHFDAEQSKDLGLPPPSVQRPVYGW